ncbi:MAG: baseplate J/gp47 family protein [bacterium]|nr:baseplate J/gp47 family protein [bacterium]
MLNSKNFKKKTFDERFQEALTQIPLYTDEWTNFNASDPGITILESLTAFETLQADMIDQVSAPILQNLLRLVGFSSRKGRCARLLLAAENVSEPVYLPANQQFRIGDLCFETNRLTLLNTGRLTGVYGKRDGVFYDYSYLCEKEIPVPGFVFGEYPKVADSVYFCASTLPEPGEELILYINVADRYNRNDFPEKGRNTFAEMKWECYTDQGFVEVPVRDYSNCFLMSGEIRIRMPQEQAALCPDLKEPAYVIRATLTRADYDVRPKLVEVQGFLFEVWQKKTLSVCSTFHKPSNVRLFSDLAEEGYVHVYAREEKGASYRRYEYATRPDIQGRYYDLTREGYGMQIYSFDKKRHGYAPEKVKNAIRIVVYTEEMMRSYSLGKVMGYDNQKLKLPVKHVVADSFSIVAKRLDENGEAIYDFVRPEREEDGNLYYHLYENEGTISIEDAGAFIGAELYIAGCAITNGPEGNIRSGSTFTTEHVPSGIRFSNPGAGSGGCFRERIADVRKRFLDDLFTPYTAVTADDYEKIVKHTPQLCIHKVKANMDEEYNRVRIAVKPGTDEERPCLSDTYRKIIEQELEHRRLLTTRIEIISPVYEPVDVRGTIYVKPVYKNCKEQIEQVIREQIDYLHSDRNFGDILRFNEVFHAIEDLECVEFVYALSLQPKHSNQAKLKETDIYPAFNCLLYPGTIVLEIDIHVK